MRRRRAARSSVGSDERLRGAPLGGRGSDSVRRDPPAPHLLGSVGLASRLARLRGPSRLRERVPARAEGATLVGNQTTTRAPTSRSLARATSIDSAAPIGGSHAPVVA